MSDGFSYHAGSGLSPDFDLYSPDFNLYEKSGFSGPDPVRTPSLLKYLPVIHQLGSTADSAWSTLIWAESAVLLSWWIAGRYL